MKQRLTLLLLTTLSCIMAWAGPVDLEQARGKAARFLKEMNGSARLASETPEYAPARSIRGVQTATSATPAFYVFNADDANGYVIVSGDDKTDEILGYSTNGSFDVDNMPENVRSWMEGYAEQIALMDKYAQQTDKDKQHAAGWTAVSPMVPTRWNQSAPYNSQCPVRNGSNCVTGCSATAMAQIMNYHKWPQEATAAIPSYRTTSESFLVTSLKATTFRWDEMQDTYSGNDNGDAVAELMRYCGQAIKSDYTTGATAAYTRDVFAALGKYFNYDQNAQQKSLFFYSPSEWETMVYNELKAKRPVYHTGQSMGGGHAFVCDGYDGKGMFHFNWGWGGSYDGYYKLALMNPGTGGIGSGSDDGYSYGQEIIIGIQPPTGEAALPKLFSPYSEQFNSSNTMFSFFYNLNAESLTAYVGFAVIDEDNNIVRLLKDCGTLTLKGGMQERQYVYLNLESDGIKLAKGTYRIGTVCRQQGSTEWHRVGSDKIYFEVTVNASNKVTGIVLHPTMDLEVTGWECVTPVVAGMEATVKVSLKNKGEEVFSPLYLFASADETIGEDWESRATVFMKEGEEDALYLTFTPESAGEYNLWVSATTLEGYELATTKVTVLEAPKRASSLQLMSVTIDKDNVSASIRVRNTSTEPYYRNLLVQLLENLYDDGYLYVTETVTLNGPIAKSAFKTYDVKFHGANSNTNCALRILYYQNHADTQATQLGTMRYFTTGETPVEDTEATASAEDDAPMYRLDGTAIKGSAQKGIYISKGKKLVAR